MNPFPSNDDIRTILARRIDQQKQSVGIAVGVIGPAGRRIITHGSLAQNAADVDGNTLFEIGSVSKVFTALLLADMVNRQEVALPDPAAKHLPETLRMPERSGKSITLLDLATHRSGLPSLPANLVARMANPHAAADYDIDDLSQFLSTYTLTRDPGSEYEYSNLGAGLLGHALATRAGTDFETLVASRIARPLGMTDTRITSPSSARHRMATGHSATLAPVPQANLPAPLAGAGALRSSAHDMLTFLEAFLGYRDSPLAPAMQAMLEGRRAAGRNQIGLGWLIHSNDGREIAWHNGATAGFRSFLGCDTRRRIGVVVLSNASTPAGVDDIGFHLLNPDLPLARPATAPTHTEIPIDPGLLDNYAGRYQVTPALVFEITRDGRRLFAQGFAQLPNTPPGDSTALPKFELFAESEQTFFAKVADHQITFETGADGRADSLILRRAGREMPAARRLP
jgi:CubicO group peptidase (beta-lactamase class C family)